MLLSVYIITYNQERYIAKAIESALMQVTDFDFEIVIGDDMSTDNTRHIIQSYIKESPEKIRLVSAEKNVGAGLNAVRTLKECKGKYIASLEGDDYWLSSDKLQKQVDILENDSSLSMCFSDRSIVNESGEVIEKNTTPKRFRRLLNSDDIIGGFTPPTQTVVFRKELLNSKIYSGLSKVFNGESYAFSYFSSLGEVAYLDEVTACYRRNDSGVYSSVDAIIRLERRENTFYELKKVLQKADHKKLDKGYNALNQRLYVIYFRKFKVLKILKRVMKLILFDCKNFKISLLRANKLLLKSLLNRNFQITD